MLPFMNINLPGFIMENNTIKNYNMAILSISFMLVFTGFNTMSGIQVNKTNLEKETASLKASGNDIQICHRPGQRRIC